MKIYVYLALLVAALASVNTLRIRRPPLGCENCRKGEVCVRDNKIRCVTTPCPQHKCITPKPGKCPASRPGYGLCIARCSHDGDCKGSLKCCGSCPRECTPPVITTCTPKCKIGYVCAPKYVVCVKPPCARLYDCLSTKPKPGICPKISDYLVSENCMYDEQCYGKKKCCRSRCVHPLLTVDQCGGCRPGYACVRMGGLCKPRSPCISYYKCVSTKTKPGVCPRIRRPPIGLRCRFDQQCYGKKKCCRGRCVDPVLVDNCGGCKPGYACVHMSGLCKAGSPCLSYYKCVRTKPKLGRCPRPAPGLTRVICRYDSQCHGFLKCCGGRCVRPIKSDPCGGCKPGYACVPKTTCKKQPCRPGYECVSTRPKLGRCPRFTISPAYVTCRYDSQCTGSWKCCRGRCVRPVRVDRCGGCKLGHACVPVTVVCKKKPCRPQYQCVSTQPKPGVCPRIPSLFIGCRYDSQCIGNLKCCKGKCIAPISRPGRCPFEPLKLCLPSEKHECEQDSDCKQPMKCCGSCHKRCVMPMVEPTIEYKPGVCPISRRMCPVPYKPKDECQKDSQCKGNDKCCRDVCGNLACLEPITHTIG